MSAVKDATTYEDGGEIAMSREAFDRMGLTPSSTGWRRWESQVMEGMGWETTTAQIIILTDGGNARERLLKPSQRCSNATLGYTLQIDNPIYQRGRFRHTPRPSARCGGRRPYEGTEEGPACRGQAQRHVTRQYCLARWAAECTREC